MSLATTTDTTAATGGDDQITAGDGNDWVLGGNGNDASGLAPACTM